MDNIIVSIVIPTYKRYNEVVRAVKSCLHQSYKNIEIIVVDDNGKNTEMNRLTYNALRSYIDAGQIIYLQNEKNSGGSYTRNQGLNIAKGKYITFLDDDDEIDDDKILKQVETLEALGDTYSCCYTGYKKILGNGKVYYSDEKIDGDVYKYALSRSIYVGSGSNILVKTQVAKEVGGYDITFKRNQDLEFIVKILKNYKLAFIDEALFVVHYEIREIKRSYEEMVAIDDKFISTFKDDIEMLGKKQAQEIYAIIALERFRYAIPRKKIIDALKNLQKNKVTFRQFLKYICYLIDRVINKKSYGFKLS
ncbi:MAG: glycosyltransferase [Erysipelotrichaceae bacterium]|nr:glycosyltransferase [Erysipelotrichaceae bacterium]